MCQKLFIFIWIIKNATLWHFSLSGKNKILFLGYFCKKMKKLGFGRKLEKIRDMGM